MSGGSGGDIPYVMFEQVRSRRAKISPGRSSSIEWALRICGSDVLDDIMEIAFDEWPAALYEPSAGLWLVPGDATFDPLGPGRSATETPHASWDCVRTYVDPAYADDAHQLAVGECRIHGSTTGGTAKILTS